MLTNQEVLVKQMVGVFLKQEKKALFNRRRKDQFNPNQKPATKDRTAHQRKSKEKTNFSGGLVVKGVATPVHLKKIVVEMIVATIARRKGTMKEVVGTRRKAKGIHNIKKLPRSQSSKV